MLDETAQNEVQTDVLIIGAGLAGLAAAYALRTSQQEVTLIEASARMGGRTHGEHWEPAGRKVDMGGTWLLPAFDESFSLLKELGVGTVESPESDLWLAHLRDGVQTKRFLTDEELAGLAATIERFQELKDASDEPLSAAEALATLRESAEGLNPVVEDWHVATQRYLAGAPLENVSIDHLMLDLKDLADPEHYHTQIDGTTLSLVEALKSKIEAHVELNTKITKIAKTSSGYEATASTGTKYEAKHVIVAMPLNSLNNLEMDSEITGSYAQLIADGHVGASRKDWFVLDGVPQHFRVFASHGPYGYFRSEDKLSETKMLCVGLTPAHEANPSVAELEEQIREYLPEASVVAHTSYDWNASAESLGTWFVPRPGQYDQIAAATPGTPNIYFVGGDVNPDFPGTIEGALLSGKQAAEAIKAATSQ